MGGDPLALVQELDGRRRQAYSKLLFTSTYGMES
jgi:hypothetical protein